MTSTYDVVKRPFFSFVGHLGFFYDIGKMSYLIQSEWKTIGMNFD